MRELKASREEINFRFGDLKTNNIDLESPFELTKLRASFRREIAALQQCN